MFNFVNKLFKRRNNKFSKKEYLEKILIDNAIKNNVDPEKLKKIWVQHYFDFLDQQYKNELSEILKQRENDFNIKISKVILSAFNRLDYEFMRDEFMIKIPLKKPEYKSRLVGLNARNKKSFERTCGVELIIKENEDNVYLSSANHFKRNIAYNVLLRLLDIKNIEPNKIENFYNEEKEKFNATLIEIGEDVILNKLKLRNIDRGLYYYVGKMRYRYSYGQNVLEHSIEVALLAEIIAREIGVDSYCAKLCAFFHDIGKSIDHESGQDHITAGIELANKYKLPKEVVNSISTHHDSGIANNIYDAITRVADKSSAAKPGARNNTKSNFYKRMKIYEDICMQFEEVKNVWVLQSGFSIKILLKPNIIDDKDIPNLSQRIKTAFLLNNETKDFVINIEIIKETYYQFNTEKPKI